MARPAGHSGVDTCKIRYPDFPESTFYAVGFDWTLEIAVPDILLKVLSALSGMLGAVRPVARKSAAVGGDKMIDELL
jgi:hypothetical protein